MVDDLYLKRLEIQAEQHKIYEQKLLKIAALNKLFKSEFGYAPSTMEHLLLWSAQYYPNSINPHDVLTKDEIVQVWEDAENPDLQ
jgi:hypothetical protein